MDVDEFLVLDPGMTIGEFLANPIYEKFDQIRSCTSILRPDGVKIKGLFMRRAEACAI